MPRHIVSHHVAPVPVERVVGVPHLALRDDGEIWLGIRVGDGQGASRARGVAVYRAGDAAVVYHHAAATSETDGEGALRMPDDFGNIDLGEEGMAWFSTLVGAVRIGNFQAVVFGEARGVRGEVVTDVLVGRAAKIWLAAAEGPGYYHQSNFEFRMPRNVIEHRPVALTMSNDGAIWGAGGRGLVRFDGEWTVYGDDDGIEEDAFDDVEADANGNLWVLGNGALYRVAPALSAP